MESLCWYGWLWLLNWLIYFFFCGEFRDRNRMFKDVMIIRRVRKIWVWICILGILVELLSKIVSILWMKCLWWGCNVNWLYGLEMFFLESELLIIWFVDEFWLYCFVCWWIFGEEVMINYWNNDVFEFLFYVDVILD